MNDNKQTILSEYDDNTALYSKLSEEIERLLKITLLENIKLHSITSRVKTKQSLENKINKKEINEPNKYKSLKEITDILGVRIITYLLTDIDEIVEIIEKEFEVDKNNSSDKRELLAPDRFGYLSRHYVVSLSKERIKLPEYKNYDEIKFEIQIRSLLQHTWAEIEHDIGYKSQNSVPEQIKRRFARLAGLLELVDEEFTGINNEVIKYRNELKDNIKEEKELSQVLIDVESIQAFLANEKLIEEISKTIAEKKNMQLIEISQFPEERELYVDLVDILKVAGFNNLEDIKTALKTYKKQIVDFGVEWITWNHPFITPGVTLRYLCYIELGLLDNIEKVANHLKNSHLYIDNDQRLLELARKVIAVCRKINVKAGF
jgi:ppGpp synthetase/RelA/SpoT-type nucleotidyltranferase